MRKLICVILFVATAASAQLIDATRIGDAVTLDGKWRMHAGDNPQWSDPHFNDSDWRVVTTAKSWDELGLQGIRGYVWFRTTVKLPAQHGQLMLLHSAFGPAELFIDGKPLFTNGRFPPGAIYIDDFPEVVPMPAVGAETMIAARYWIPALFGHVGHLANDFVIGGPSAISAHSESDTNGRLARLAPFITEEVCEAAVIIGLLVLFGLQRERWEYLFLALALLTDLLGNVAYDVGRLSPTDMVSMSYLSTATNILSSMAMIEFAFRFISEPMPRWLRAYQFALPLNFVATVGFWQGWLSNGILNLFVGVYLIPYWFLTPGVVIWRAFRGNKEAGLLALPISLLMLNSMLGLLGWVAYQFHLRSSPQPFIHDLQIGTLPISPDVLFGTLFLFSIAGLILYRFQTTRLEQVRADSELEAARSMQEVMVPKSVAAPGFQIETAYIPAQEVGGDFFQLFPLPDGSMLIVIGDVSGKGMKAAMLVSLILGALTRTVHATRSPAQILQDLNTCLIGQTDGKFATCCCALLKRNGALTIANAGHLSPYCDGDEIELPGGVPLGISKEVDYIELTFQIPSGKRIVFLSDGVVEARSKSGELYGFERTRIISIRAVDEIAATARHFGQEDDITVVGIMAFA